MPQKVELDAHTRKFVAGVVSSYSQQLHAFLRRRVRRAEDLDDLAQEVYLRLLRIRDVASVRNPLAYVYGVAAHVASEFHMREHKECVSFDSPLVDGAINARSEAMASQHAECGALWQYRVNDALNQLPDMYLAVLLLERREGLTHAQIAERLGLSVHTVKKYGVQALARVRLCLKQ